MRGPAVAAHRVPAVAAGPGALRALVDGATGSVELAFGGGGYVRLDTGRVLLAGPRAPLGPLSLLVAGLSAESLRPGAPAAAAGGRLRVGDLEVDVCRARRPRAPRTLTLGTGWWEALAAALARLPGPPRALAPGLRALARGDVRAATAVLAGLGEGLTPAGDDVLAGFAAWRWTRGRPVRIETAGCAPLGRDYLDCAGRGELPEPAAAVLAAVYAGEARAAARRAGALGSWGASSGAALAWGMAAGAGWEPVPESPVEPLRERPRSGDPGP
jgi:hypothetical protein